MSRAIAALDHALATQKMTVLGETDDRVAVEVLEIIPWDSQDRGRLLDKPDKLKVRVLDGPHAGAALWVSSHWVRGGGDSSAVGAATSRHGNTEGQTRPPSNGSRFATRIALGAALGLRAPCVCGAGRPRESCACAAASVVSP